MNLHEMVSQTITAIWANKFAIAAVAGAWLNGWLTAFSASLPNPDDPADWPANSYPYGVKYRTLYKTLRLRNNQKPQPVSLQAARTQEMLRPKQ